MKNVSKDTVKKAFTATIPVMTGFLFLGIYIGGASIFYYSIPLMIFVAIGVGAVGCLLDWIIKKMCGKDGKFLWINYGLKMKL